jgi:hypothetical protein
MDNDWAQTIAAMASSAAAIAAIVIGYFQFKKQLTTADKVAHANVKPLLGINLSDYVDHKAVKLRNYGVGAAEITSIQFKRNDGKKVQKLPDLFKLPYDPIWDDYTVFPLILKLPYDLISDDYTVFPRNKQYITAGQEMILAMLTKKGLAENNPTLQGNQISEILVAWTTQLKGITIEIAYNDVLDKQQPICVRKF